MEKRGDAKMTLKSKQKLVELIASLAWFGGYLIYAFSVNAPETDNLQGWAMALLIAIVISVGVLMIACAGFNLITSTIMIAQKEANGREDISEIKACVKNLFAKNEHDKAINAKANSMTLSCIAIGVGVSLVAMAFGINAVLGLHIILCFSCCIGVAVGCIYSITIYERERKM
jgi:hypothetical protein